MCHHVVGEIARRGRHPRRVLDVGCSVGYGSFILSRESDQIGVIGIDIEQQKIEDARRLFDADQIGFRHLDRHEGERDRGNSTVIIYNRQGDRVAAW